MLKSTKFYDYHELYVRVNTLQSAEAFKNIRKHNIMSRIMFARSCLLRYISY